MNSVWGLLKTYSWKYRYPISTSFLLGGSAYLWHYMEKNKLIMNDGLYIFMSTALEKILPVETLNKIKSYNNVNVNFNQIELINRLNIDPENKNVEGLKHKFRDMHRNKIIVITFDDYVKEQFSADEFVQRIKNVFEVLITEQQVNDNITVNAELTTLRDALIKPATVDLMNTRLEDKRPYLNIVNIHGDVANCLHICVDNHLRGNNEAINLESYICKFAVSKNNIKRFGY